MLLARIALATLMPTALAAAQQQAQEPVRLAPELRTGDSFVFTVSTESASKFEDARKDVSMFTSMTFTASVGEHDQGTAKVTCRLDRLQLRARSPNARTDYDSAAPLPDSGPLQKLRDLTGSTFALRVAPSGEVTEVAPPPLLDKSAEDSIGADFRTLFSAWFVALPVDPMAVGATWTGSTKLFGVMPGGKETAVQHRLASVDGTKATITAAYQPQPPTARPGVQFELRESEGAITVDLAARRVVRTEARLLARATRSAGAETATSSIVVRGSLGDAEDKSQPADAKDAQAPKPR